MCASAIMKNGIPYLKVLLREMQAWMNEKGCEKVADFRGLLNQKNIADPAAFERANYIKTLQEFRKELVAE